MGNQNQKHKKNTVIPPLTETVLDVEPNIVGFTLTQNHLEEIVKTYFSERGLPLRGTIVKANPSRRDGTRLILEQYLFFDMHGQHSATYGGKQRGNVSNINPALAKRMPTGGIKLKDNFNAAIRPLALPDNKTRVFPSNNGLVVVPIDPLLVIAIVVGAKPGIHRVSVTNVEKTKHGIYIDVFKRLEENNFDPGAKKDIFERALSSINRF